MVYNVFSPFKSLFKVVDESEKKMEVCLSEEPVAMEFVDAKETPEGSLSPLSVTKEDDLEDVSEEKSDSSTRTDASKKSVSTNTEIRKANADIKTQKTFFQKYSPENSISVKTVSASFVDANMPSVTLNQKLYWGRSSIPGCGNGVYSSENVKKGDIVEISPLLLDVDSAWTPKSRKAAHENYTITYDPKFNHWKKNMPKDKKDMKRWSGFMLGYGALYNHSDDPDAEYHWGACNTVMIVALKDIPAHKEIFIHYGDDYWACDTRKGQQKDSTKSDRKRKATSAKKAVVKGKKSKKNTVMKK